MTDAEKPNEGELILYQTQEGAVRIEVLYESETFWLNQKKIAELFGVDLRTISEHLQKIYASGELSREATLRKIRRVQKEGNREVSREIEFYNLDAIISVGYRVNSAQATQFRIWATQTLREFVIKGFVLDDERLKLNKRFNPWLFRWGFLRTLTHGVWYWLRRTRAQRTTDSNWLGRSSRAGVTSITAIYLADLELVP